MKITSEVRKLFYVYAYENLESVCSEINDNPFIYKAGISCLAIHARLCFYGRADIFCSQEDVFINEFTLFLWSQAVKWQ